MPSPTRNEPTCLIIHYLNDVGACATIPSIDAPNKSFESLEPAMKASLANERAVTRAVHNMVAIAQRENDYSTRTFLEWFVAEDPRGDEV